MSESPDFPLRRSTCSTLSHLFDTITWWALASVDCFSRGFCRSLLGNGTICPFSVEYFFNEKHRTAAQGVWQSFIVWVPEVALCSIFYLNSIFLAMTWLTTLSQMYTYIKYVKFIKKTFDFNTNSSLTMHFSMRLPINSKQPWERNKKRWYIKNKK